MKFETDIVLGEKYEDRTTGFSGTAIGIFFYQHACERVCLRALNLQTGDVMECTFDSPELVHIASQVQAKSERPGGPDRGGVRSGPARR